MENMLTPQELEDLRYSNAIEEFPYYDTFVLGSQMDNPENARFRQAGYLASYAELGALGELPFFKLRNRASVGLPYCNMDVKDRFNLPFHVFGIGIQFKGSLIASGQDPNDQFNTLLFAQELPKHCGFSFKVGQDEKLVAHVGYLPGGAGLYGSTRQLGGTGWSGSQQSQNTNNGKPYRWNVYPLETPIQIPRNETVEASIRISSHGQKLLSGMVGPGEVSQPTGDPIPQTCLIRVSLYGVREVQLRNLQHF